ncbi:MAG: polysaccharide deacetylase [Lachnospiraceae bacterium]|nr:polysaccharide deacetylase [Lachnospiraceae bacterium]
MNNEVRRHLDKKERIRRLKMKRLILIIVMAVFVAAVVIGIAAIVHAVRKNSASKSQTAAVTQETKKKSADAKSSKSKASSKSSSKSSSKKSSSNSKDSSDTSAKTEEKQYIWASPKGAATGNKEDPLPESDPSLLEGKEKIIYLTFDDGPGPYTSQLLDILKNHNVKVTFFVTHQFPEYQDMLKREAEEGHSIGVHSYTHDYKLIYSGEDQYWTDFNNMENVIEQETGYRTELVRFPGGSSNTVSRFNQGIMTRLTQQVEGNGYTYVDWNVSSGDGSSKTSTESVISNCETQCSSKNTSVVLCHDVKQSTVNAIDTFLTWGEQNGFTFLPMSPHSNPFHQHINN